MPALARRRPDAPRSASAEDRGEFARPRGKPAPRRLTRHGHGVGRGVDVAKPRQLGDAQPGRMQPGPLMAPVLAVDIGTPRTRAASGTRRPSAQKPPSAAGPNQASAASQSDGEQAGGDLRRVHPDEQRGAVYRGERAGQPLVEAAAALRHDVEPGRQPRPRLAVEDQHPPPRGGREHGVQRVGQRGLGQRGGLPGRARRHQAGLDPSGPRLLGDDEQGGVRSGARQAAGRARSPGQHPAHVPDGAHGAAHRPGHLRLADAGQVGDLDLGRRQPAAAALSTISSG